MVDTVFSIFIRENRIYLLCFLLAALASFGCAIHTPPNKALPAPEVLNELNQGIAVLYPDKFKALHHVILTLSGKDYVLDGYLFIDRKEKKIDLIAQNDLGGIFFEVRFIKNIEKTIHLNVNRLKEKWLEKSVLRDIEALYLMEPFPSPSASFDPDKNLIVSQHLDQITKALYYSRIDTATPYRLNEIRHLTDNKCVYTIKLQYGMDAENPYPEFIIIKDTKMNYSLQIFVRYFM